MRIVIPINPITKKNSQQIIYNKALNRSFLIPSKQYREYELMAGQYLLSVRKGIDYPVNIKCVYYMKTKRKVDLVNLQEATLDVLVKYGVIKDDNSSIVVSMDGSRVEYDKLSPRTEIWIEDLSNLTGACCDGDGIKTQTQ